MGRGRQKAKQTRMARKLKYLTTDTDYDELARELSSEQAEDRDEQVASVSEQETSEATDVNVDSQHEGTDDDADVAFTESGLEESETTSENTADDLDEYAQWAAQVAHAAAEHGDNAIRKHKPMPIPMPVPKSLKK